MLTANEGGHRKALDRLWAHEARRSHRRPVPLDERRWINSLGSPELEQHVRELRQVDRAVDGYKNLPGTRGSFASPAAERAA